MLLKSFILTSEIKSSKSSTSLHYWVKSDQGPFELVFTNQPTVFFISNQAKFNPSVEFSRKNVNLKSFDGNLVDAIYLNNYNDFSFVKEYCLNNSIRTFEIDVRPNERFLMERFINGQIEFESDGNIKQLNPRVRSTNYFPKLSIMSIDIETGVDNTLYSIGIHQIGNTSLKKVLMLSDSCLEDDFIEYFDSEKKIISKFIEIVHKYDPDIICGWHVIGFDLMFIEKKCFQFNIDLSLGRDLSKVRLEQRNSGFFAKISGRVVLDGPPLIRNSFYSFKNYKLETVAQEVLGIGKDIESSGSDKVEEIERRFREDKPSLAKYNLLDCTLVLEIFEKLDLINLLMTRVQISGMLMDRVGISTAAFDHFMLPRIHRSSLVAPNTVDIDRDESSSGGMVFEPKVGIHENIAIFDFKSLYPSIIRTFKIDPFSLLHNTIDSIVTPSNIRFSSTKHFLPQHIEELMELRKLAKSSDNKSLSQAIKILMNSFYGVMGSSKSRFYHSNLPEAITKTGHWILERGKEFFENRSLDVIYGDTDSLFVKGEKLDEQMGQALANDLNHYLGKLIYDEFKVKSYLELEFEKIFEKMFFPTSRASSEGAKKRYVGYSNRNLQFVGMEFVRSDWTDLAKNFQFALFMQLFQGLPLEEIIKITISKIQNGDFDDQLVITKKLSKDPKEYTKNIPPHVQAALLLEHNGPYRLKEISYCMTKEGPVPTQHLCKNFDYQYYIDKQLRPIANDILRFMNDDFDSYILGDQLTLF